MSIPLDELYNFLEGKSNHPIIIYRYFPHGSKKLTDCVPLHDIAAWNLDKKLMLPMMWCHDQEPLNFDQYRHITGKWINQFENQWTTYYQDPTVPFFKFKHNMITANIHDRVLLLHSEKNSIDLEKFVNNGAIGVYYWSHALIARDWYRYAESDPGLKIDTNNIVKDFIIYCRAWTGTREYRLKFLELLIDSQLDITSQVNFAETDGGHYTCHQYANSELECKHNTLEQHFTSNIADSNSSARYSLEDYNNCGVDVVLETIFDDKRIQLTEKVLRPLACGKPFILVSTPGALDYLRSYGFKTFDSLIDESYDTIQDPVARLNAVISSMKKISSLSKDEKKFLWTKLNEICCFNREHFFSKQFMNLIVNEYQQNINQAIKQLTPVTGVYFQQWLNDQISKKEMSNFGQKIASIAQCATQLRKIDPSQAVPGGTALYSSTLFNKSE
jgi:hypothetical protein